MEIIRCFFSLMLFFLSVREPNLNNPQECYKFLVDCSLNNDIQTWNNWIKKRALSIDKSTKVKIPLNGANLSNLNLADIDLRNVDLRGAILVGADLSNALLLDSDLSHANFTHARLTNAVLDMVDMKKAHFAHSILDGINITSSDMQGGYFFASNIDNASIKNCRLQEADFRKSSAQSTLFIASNLRGAIFTEADLSESSFVEYLVDNIRYPASDMQEIDLSYSTLTNTQLSGVKMNNCKFNGADLHETNMENAILTDSEFERSQFRSTNVGYADLRGARLLSSSIPSVDFSTAKINSDTFIRDCLIDDRTLFSPSALDNAQIPPDLLSLLKTNIRRASWNDYLSNTNGTKTFFLKFFWWITDDGTSSYKIPFMLFVFSLVFAVIYAYINANSSVFKEIVVPEKITLRYADTWRWFLQLICFSLISYFSIGFSQLDIFNRQTKYSSIAMIVISCNLLIGYIFLAILVAHINIMFQSLAP